MNIEVMSIFFHRPVGVPLPMLIDKLNISLDDEEKNDMVTVVDFDAHYDGKTKRYEMVIWPMLLETCNNSKRIVEFIMYIERMGWQFKGVFGEKLKGHI